MVAFQSAFRVEIYQNDVFFIFKKLFLKSAHQNDSKHTKKNNFSKKNEFFRNAVCTAFPNGQTIALGHLHRFLRSI